MPCPWRVGVGALRWRSPGCPEQAPAQTAAGCLLGVSMPAGRDCLPAAEQRANHQAQHVEEEQGVSCGCCNQYLASQDMSCGLSLA